MPVKWTPTNVQMLLWLAWGNCKYEVKDIIDGWPSIPGEEAPTKRAIQEKMGGIRKGVRDYGIASFFGNGAPIPKRSKRPATGPSQQMDKLDSVTTGGGLQCAAEHGNPAIKDEVPSTSMLKQEARDEVTTIATEPAAATLPDLGTNMSQTRGLHEQVRRENGTPNAGVGKYNNQYLTTPPKTLARGGQPSVATKYNGRKRRLSDADTGSDSASMTTETTPSAVSIDAPHFDMNLRSDHRNVNLYESDGEYYDADSDDAWVPGVEEGRGSRKRVRRH